MLTVKDLTITCPFKVYDCNRSAVIYCNPYHLDTMPDDMPDEVRNAPAIRIYTYNNIIYIDTEV